MSPFSALRAGVLLGAVFFAFGGAAAQSEAPVGTFGAVSNTVANTANYFFFTEPGAPTVRVEVWGALASPGLYDVEAGTDLRTLVTLAGGLSSLNSSTVRSEVNVTLIRSDGGARRAAETLDADELLKREPVLLQDGDAVYVEVIQRNKFTLRDGITLIASVLAIVTLYERLSE